MGKRIVYILLAMSLGINIGLISTSLLHKTGERRPGPGPGAGPPVDPRRMVEHHVTRMTLHLGLSPEQQKAIRSLLERSAPQQTHLQLEVQKTSRRLADAFSAPEFDEKRFFALVREASDARSRLDFLSAEMLVGEASVLTPEQRRMFAEVAPTIHAGPQRPQRDGGPPRRGRGPRGNEPPPPH